VLLPFAMLNIILDVSALRRPRWVMPLLTAANVLVFLVAASPGYLDCYYRDVSLTFINGMAKLEKVYGPLHSIYLIYLLTYMGLMAGVILHARIKRKAVSHKHAILLMVVTLLNMVIWGVEQLIYTEFELLSVSYIVSEFLLLVLCGMMQDNGIPADRSPAATPATEGAGASHTALDADRILFLSEKWAPEYTLTTRETQVLVALLQNKRHQEIADDMNVSEHTVRKHTDSIFSKMEISGHADLFALAARS
jgi:DNA-binding CsgD family transcriptional regulator